ncbi:MAG: acyl-CoA dehydrogenase [Nocardioidaceae bacterium]|nr:acyl-CoA dehydrogenase [Nocardioidaceae bacterium]
MSSEFDVDPSLISTVSQFFSKKSGHEVVVQAEAEGLLRDLWQATEELGLPLVGVDEEAGGNGGTLLDILTIVKLAAQNAVPLPIAETHLAAWLLARSGQKVSEGPSTIVPGSPRDTLALRAGVLSGIAYDVPWARHVDRIVALVPDETGSNQVVEFSPASCVVTPGTDLAGQARDKIELPDVAVTSAASTISAEQLNERGALVRAAQIAGGLEAVSNLTRNYVGERVQFGRPVGKFQAVQQHVVVLAQMATMTELSVTRAGRAAATRPASFEVYATKLVANENARIAVRAAHQAHGAIGMTQEYRLQQLTRRLHAWRSEFGTEVQLALRLGAAVAEAGTFARIATDDNNHLEV